MAASDGERAPGAWKRCSMTGSREAGPRGERTNALQTGRPPCSFDVYRDSALDTVRREDRSPWTASGWLQPLKGYGGDCRDRCRRTLHVIHRGLFHSESTHLQS